MSNLTRRGFLTLTAALAAALAVPGQAQARQLPGGYGQGGYGTGRYGR